MTRMVPVPALALVKTAAPLATVHRIGSHAFLAVLTCGIKEETRSDSAVNANLHIILAQAVLELKAACRL